MANDDKVSLAKLNNKQKIIAVVLVVVVLIFIWQLIGMFGGGSSKPPAPIASNVPKPAMTANARPAVGGGPATPGSPNPAPVPGSAPPMAAPDQATQILQQTNVMTIPNDRKLLDTQQQEQKNFIEALNKLQLLKVQREIAETDQAISSAKLATATADKGMSDLLTKPTQPTMPANAYANSLVSPAQAGMPLMAGQPNARAAPAPIAEAPYVVISVSMELNRWNAVLGMQGKLYNVGIGDQLPDGSTVARISKEGVELIKDNQRRRISILSSI